ncbi:hypothetical protein OG562_10920 [Streptomyces sp. NBC_01275]|uniref:hypothetical protein n=1 Tax=Streptomyces sp. NBC_01275 TaxID=2903807 RepID=UPI00224D240C|nr:hypothetical protein [Streptomyces sp. NBC_01275]MCX4761483.1 hypothetical protein [Streptomyces sp. NBC_01275]
MNTEALAWAGTFSSAVIAAMATDAWQETRTRVVGVWQRFHPAFADSINEQLGAAQLALSLLPENLRHEAEGELVNRWRNQILQLLQRDPAVSELLAAALSGNPGQPETQVRQVGHVHGNGRIYMAGRDVTITDHD